MGMVSELKVFNVAQTMRDKNFKRKFVTKAHQEKEILSFPIFMTLMEANRYGKYS
jgi:hypothetical protein